MSKSFSDIMETSEDTVLIVDALNLAFRWKHMGSTFFREDYYNTVYSLANSYNCGKIIITADMGQSWYRKAIHPEYKGNRKKLQETQTDEEKKAFKDFIVEYNNTLQFLEDQDLLVLKYENTEADDIAAYLTKIMTQNIWLISTDRDWDLLINKRVNRFSYVTRKEVTINNWPYDVSIEDYISFKCLTGDTGDNIPGITGIGPKRAATLIEKYGSVFDIYDHIPLAGTAKFIQNLNAGKELLLLNHELMDLLTYCGEALGKEVCDDIRYKTKEYLGD